MALIKTAQIQMSYDQNGAPQMVYIVGYADGGVAQGNCSGQFAQQLIGTFFPQAMADLVQGQKDDGDQGMGI